ncbi:MAG: hypothetical protein ACO3J2_05910 [Chthoniobacterales bacterium]
MRHFAVLLAVAALLAGGYFLLAPRSSLVEGRVVLRGLDGRETPGAGAKVGHYPAAVVESGLESWLRDYDESRAQNRLEVQAARRLWERLAGHRDEAARILRAAQRSNSADLEICRARHREAVADAEDALRRDEEMNTGLDEATDPVRFVAGLPPAGSETSADGDGIFRVEVPGDALVYLVAQLPGQAPEQETLVWLRRGPFEDGEKVQFSSGNLLTGETLAGVARAAKKPESPAGSPAR